VSRNSPLTCTFAQIPRNYTQQNALFFHVHFPAKKEKKSFSAEFPVFTL